MKGPGKQPMFHTNQKGSALIAQKIATLSIFSHGIVWSILFEENAYSFYKT